MPAGVDSVYITYIRDHWEVYIDNKFFCSTDSYMEAINEIRAEYGDQ